MLWTEIQFLGISHYLLCIFLLVQFLWIYKKPLLTTYSTLCRLHLNWIDLTIHVPHKVIIRARPANEIQVARRNPLMPVDPEFPPFPMQEPAHHYSALKLLKLKSPKKLPLSIESQQVKGNPHKRKSVSKMLDMLTKFQDKRWFSFAVGTFGYNFLRCLCVCSVCMRLVDRSAFPVACSWTRGVWSVEQVWPVSPTTTLPPCGVCCAPTRLVAPAPMLNTWSSECRSFHQKLILQLLQHTVKHIWSSDHH